MKYKILLTGDSPSCGAFLKSLSDHLGVKLTGAISSGNIGVVRYVFDFHGDEIELNYIEELPRLKKNYKHYAVGAHGVIFVNAKEETCELLVAACDPSVQIAKNRPGKTINGVAGINRIINLCREEKLKLTSNPNVLFQPADLERGKPSVAKIAAVSNALVLDELKAALLKKSAALKI